MAYNCLVCKKVIDNESVKKRIRCTFCGSKILVKKPVSIDRKLKAL
ncbi:MAG: DNA-directed RNA polymerase subunit P [Candidatus Nanoarchaeia archaeon]|nr:DNA-directed RNA polymerase subunit P [Candidatus Nanoarchaeia archaeon]MDD5054082.1 DNA-directed RNA polymerase subunit P [Candidatus Nanoarchaeia archaeon]MDD5499520.1 DNA-directed RNA polymerase subunit P [Candidatus Nanoarchaeia archaeon]